MKKVIVFLFVVFSQISIAQVTKSIGDFDEVKVFDRLNVTLIPATENKIEITGSRSNEVEFVNKNGQLKIRMSVSKLLKGEEITIKLYFKNLQDIDASEGSFITCNAVLKQTAIEITTKEGAQIQLKIDVQKAEIKAVTGGIIKLSGTAFNQEVTIGTGGILEAENLQTSQSTVSITTGGEADVRASEFVDAKIKVGGTITIFGNPKQINKKTILGGTIIESKR
jgi:hypothetical protein